MPTRHLARAFVAGIVLLGLAACTGGKAAPVVGPPLPSAGAPENPRLAALAAGDLPSGLRPCPSSSDIGQYLKWLNERGWPTYRTAAAQWASMQGMGATGGWVEVYAAQSTDCAADLGQRQGPAATSFTIRFRAAAGASQAFDAGFFGLRPEPGMVAPGLRQGESTGLGSKAWTQDETGRPPGGFLAYWTKGDFDLFLLTEGLSAEAALKAASGMNSRVG